MINKINANNRLSGEKSPYLLQHADNPVDWHPWSEEAFDRARSEDKPVFISIGYSTCHWCHVMAHESFEDSDVADILNRHFISVKVDREERPDIDNIYMKVCQMMTGRGGWPLTIFTTPDKKPFFAATYLPKTPRLGHPGLIDLLNNIIKYWKGDRKKILNTSEEISAVLNRPHKYGRDGLNPEKILFEAFKAFTSSYDMRYGGFGASPKFPTPHNLLFLLRYWKKTGEKYGLDMALGTLRKMRMGGIYDQAGFGFHRYSTDAKWLVPHFEKMLYDQALLAIVYLEAYQASGDSLFKDTAEEIFTYVLRDMTSREGGFYSAEDADSEGREGRFYLWTEEEVRRLLKPDDAESAIKIFNVRKEGNYIDEMSGTVTGENILHLKDDIDKVSSELSLSLNELNTRLENIRMILFSEREKRFRPHKDDKILTDWNGLMAAALAIGGRILNNDKYLEAAKKAARFINDKMMTPGFRLLHRYRGGEAAITGNIDDYAYIIWALVELYMSTFDAAHLALALRLSESALAHFADAGSGTIFFTPDDGEKLISRPVTYFDGATPSGNSVLAYNFIRLGRITGDTKWEEAADKIINAASDHIQYSPAGHSMFLLGINMISGGSREIIISGDREDESTRKMLDLVNHNYLPDSIVILLQEKAEDQKILEIAPYLKEYHKINGKSAAYVCRKHGCEKPVTDAGDLLNLLL
ncbi:MAG: thioredoxin domain-containing protein [Spirochaetes bacterium]|nr:thioredoxin domain-containing protein [Spirochaetota bacterium]